MVFGCGGDRDAGKRPMMGAIAAENADRVIVTDDNPRSEQPAAIRAAILGRVTGRDRDRRPRARRSAARSPQLRRGDVLLIAGKGHETGQIVGEQVLPFSDHEAVAAALKGKVRMSDRRSGPSTRWRRPCARTRAGALPRVDSRHLDRHAAPISAGEAFFAIKGDNRDGHEFVPAALAGRRRPRGGGRRQARCASPPDAPLLVVPDVLDGLRDLARAARARSPAKIIARHRLGRQDRHQGGAAARARRAMARPTPRSPPTTITGACRCRSRAARRARASRVFEIGMNHAGEIEPLTRLVRPHVAIVTTIEPVHLEFFGSLDAIADAKAEIFLGLEPGGAAVHQSRQPAIRAARARARRAPVSTRIVSFGEHAEADARLHQMCRCRRTARPCRRSILGCERHLQARCAGPACRAQFARGARRLGARRRRSGARGARARAICSPRPGAARA